MRNCGFPALALVLGGVVCCAPAWAGSGGPWRGMPNPPGCSPSDSMILPPSHRKPPVVGSYAELHYPGVTRGRLIDLLQQFVDDQQGSSFRYLGDGEDFFHGHLLFLEGDENPKAILYHTQEHRHPPGAPNDKYDALGSRDRNWLQWFDGRPIANARAWERTSYPADEFWRSFQDYCLPRYRSARTVTSAMLDPGMLGGEAASDFEFDFVAVDCRSLPALIPADSAAFELRVAGGKRACLVFTPPD